MAEVAGEIRVHILSCDYSNRCDLPVTHSIRRFSPQLRECCVL